MEEEKTEKSTVFSAEMQKAFCLVNFKHVCKEKYLCEFFFVVQNLLKIQTCASLY